ncbi:hypothetical protein [Burkholderia sp. Tr-862]|uniref:hypothetical protein n=1 Tax=Burkholderia sp. Tr-862 TaxID=2608331 RepID=UPI0014196F73|nr:hypothetical protein [Burkholderia sp. Tr-862]
MAAPLSGASAEKTASFRAGGFFMPALYARATATRVAGRIEINKNLLISWTSARSSDRPYNSG